MLIDDESEDYYERRVARADAAFDLFIDWTSVAAMIGIVLYLLLRC
jgi:hypothetical protein